MIGIVITGHGHFATGLTASIELIAGKPEDYVPVDFTVNDSTESLEKNLREAFASLKHCTDGILVFTDLVGGSPFKTAVELSVELSQEHKIVVLSGSNLGMLIEANMSRSFMNDLDELANATVETGKTQVIRYEMQKMHHEESDGDGI